MNRWPTATLPGRRRRLGTLAVAGACLAAGVLASGCGASDTGSATTTPAAQATVQEARGKVTLAQCTGEKRDRQVTYDTVPQKVFTLDPQSAEFLIALGVGDRIVGSWGMYSDEQLDALPQYAAQLRKIKVIGDDKTWPPPIEQIAATGPDIVVTTYRLNIPGYLDADRLQKDAGIAAYSFTSYCTGQVMRTLDPVYADIESLGAIFDVEPAAAELVATMKAQVEKAAEVAATTKDRPTIWQYAGEEVPYPIGGSGVPNAIVTLAGGQNVFEDVKAVYGEVSWEQIAERKADVVWLQTDAGPGFIEAEGALRKAVASHAGLSGVPGVAAKRYVVVPYTTAGTLSVHNAEAVLEFATKLKEATSTS